jgi:hypothetical protein
VCRQHQQLQHVQQAKKTLKKNGFHNFNMISCIDFSDSAALRQRQPAAASASASASGSAAAALRQPLQRPTPCARISHLLTTPAQRRRPQGGL